MPSTTTTTSGSNRQPVEFVGVFFLMKEIQRNISFRAYEEVCAMGDGKQLKDLYELVYTKYHGKGNDGLGLAQKFMQGLEMFEGIYEDKLDEVNGKHERVLKNVLHCKGIKIISDKEVRLGGINMTTLTANKYSKNKSKLQGRQIWEMGKQVEENGRKVLAIVSRSRYKEGQLASGESWEDYLKFCRYKMDQLSKEKNKDGAKTKKKKKQQNQFTGEDKDNEQEEVVNTNGGAGDEFQQEDEEDPDDADNNVDSEAQAIKDWESTATFPGYLAWALWGHIVMPGMEEYKSQQFSAETKSVGDKTRKSRVASRSNKAKEEAVARGTEEGRGLSRRDELLSEHFHRSNEFYDKLEMQGDAEFVRSCLKNRLEHAEAMLQRVSPIVYSKPEYLLEKEKYKDWEPIQEFLQCKKEIAIAKAQLTCLGDEAMERINNRKRKSSSPAAVRGRSSTPTSARTGVSSSSLHVPSEVIAVDGLDTPEQQQQQQRNYDVLDDSSSSSSSVSPLAAAAV